MLHRTPLFDDANIIENEGELQRLISAFPHPLHPASTSPLDPTYIQPIATVANTRLLLHRLGLAPVRPARERLENLEKCVDDARLTTNAISRSMPPVLPNYNNAPSLELWKSRLPAFTPAALCKHLWRCIVVLSITCNFAEAMTCVRMSAAIGNLRDVNMACGRSAVFLLERLRERMLEGRGSKEQLARDEEMLAYVSADLQGHVVQRWALDWWSSSRVGETYRGGERATRPLQGGGSPWPRVEALLGEIQRMQRDRSRGGESIAIEGLMASGSK